MNDDHLKTLAQVRAFLDGTQTVEFSLHSKTERYDFIRRSLIRFAYHTLSKPDKGLLLSFMSHVSGYSRIQLKRLTKTWLEKGELWISGDSLLNYHSFKWLSPTNKVSPDTLTLMP